MKRVFKLIVIVLITCLLVCGCKKDKEVVEPETKVTEEEKITNNIISEDLGTINGEYLNRYTIVKVTNKNDVDLYVEVKVTYYNNNFIADEDNVYVYVGAGKSVYAVSRMYSEDAPFTSHKYETILLNKIDGYNDIINNITVSKQRNANSITVTMSNNGKRTTTAKALLLFYKNNKIVAVNESTQYNLMPTSVKSEEIELPHRSINELIQFDTVDVFINEVSISL